MPYFLSSKILSLNILYNKFVAILMQVVIKNITTRNIIYLFTPTQKIDSYNTRASSRSNYGQKYSRIQKNYFSRIDVKSWNSIPINIKKVAKTKFEEKKKTNYSFLTIFSDTNQYAEIPILINLKKMRSKYFTNETITYCGLFTLPFPYQHLIFRLLSNLIWNSRSKLFCCNSNFLDIDFKTPYWHTT